MSSSLEHDNIGKEGKKNEDERSDRGVLQHEEEQAVRPRLGLASRRVIVVL